jgi:hypothetical protein
MAVVTAGKCVLGVSKIVENIIRMGTHIEGVKKTAVLI